MKNERLQRVIIGLCPLIGLSFALYATWCNIGLTFDSYDYLFASHTFSAQGILQNADQTVFRERTPLFPVLLYCLQNNMIAIRIAFGIAYLSVFYGFQTIFSKLVDNTKHTLYFSLLFCFSVPLLLIQSFLWSEVFFLFLLSLSSYCLLQFTQDNKPYTYLLLASCLGFLYCLQRNTGIFFVTGSAVYLLLDAPQIKRFLLASLYAGIAFSGWFAWTLFHYLEKGIKFQPTLSELGENILPNCLTYLESYSSWIVPHTISPTTRIFTLVIVALLLSFLIYNSYVQLKDRFKRQLIKLCVILFLSYHAGMIMLERAIIWEVDRFIAIEYPFLILLCGIAISDYLKTTTTFKKTLATTFLCFWLLYPVVRTLKNAHFYHQNQCK